ncbi:hypothetical protein M427DRAFT_50686 [Gonapodya prolifera JEL478]|uniref:SWI5-dependent HO expression protein 3 n=1 Tax=Gonapodya prolifera (strain JEL478) TaxID=1344416 RepID=A0A139B032_GONPJ|nr:hypothetical protein M427DRAFT_50686 [Gonapodya prolifera JEL478]|eukprot:KXS22351.1 hypothetical protein M427DRAFT_50686 [Gonapodya prolifera JEL478]
MTTATLTTLPRLSPRAHGVGQSQSFSIQQPQRLPSLPQSNSIPPLKTPIPTFDQPGESLSSAAVKRLLQLCEELKRTADDKTREAEERARETEVVKREMRVMEAELAYRNDRIASAKARLAKEARAEEVASESHHLLHSELRRRVLAEQALSETRLFIADARQAREDAERARHEAQMAEQEARLGKERAEKVVEEWKEKMNFLRAGISSSRPMTQKHRL